MRVDPIVHADSKPPNRFLRALRRHAWWMVLLVIAVSVLVAREWGIVTLDRYDFEKSAIVNVKLSEEITEGAEPAGGYAVKLDSRIDEATAAGLQEELRAVLGADAGSYSGVVEIDLPVLEYSGKYNMPYSKRGEVRFEAAVKVELRSRKKSANIHGTLDGRIEFTAKGFCAVYSLKKEIGRQIGKQINQELSNRFLRTKE